MKSRFACAGLLVVLALLPARAGAHHNDPNDANDTRGLLDVRRVESFERPRRGFSPAWRIFTFPGWRAIDIYDRGYALVNLDTFGSRRADYYIMVRANRARLVASLWRDTAKRPDRFVSSVRTWRPGRRSLAVRVPISKMSRGDRLNFRWYVQTIFTSDRCPRVCFDRVPNGTGTFVESNGRPRPPDPSPPSTPPDAGSSGDDPSTAPPAEETPASPSGGATTPSPTP